MPEDIVTWIARVLARTSEEVILPSFRGLSDGDISEKTSAIDVVTKVDLKSEVMIAEQIRAVFSGAPVVGEEAVAENPGLLSAIKDSDICFVVDPIDGTLNYARGLPVFGVIVAVIENGVTTCGVIFDPITGDYLSAVKGGGAKSSRYNGSRAPLRLNTMGKPVDHMNGLASFEHFKKDLQPQVFSACGAFSSVTSLGCSAYDYRLASTGVVDFVFGSRLKPWDHAAGQLIHSEAGGFSALLSGEHYEPAMTDGVLLTAPSREAWLSIRKAFDGIPLESQPRLSACA